MSKTYVTYDNLDASAIYELLLKSDLQLNLPKIMKLDKHQQDLIIKLFDNLMESCHTGGMRVAGGLEWHPQQMVILFRTLTEQSWLVNAREVKLDELV
jgi:hypothetical protein